MPEDAEIERLVRLISDRVMARLRVTPEATPPPARPLWLLLAGPSGGLQQVASQAGRLLHAGAGLRLLAVPGLEQVGQRLGLPGPVEILDPATLCALLDDTEKPAALVLTGVGLQLGRQIVSADDEKPAVRLVWHFLLRDWPVLLLQERIRSSIGGEGAAVQRARQLERELQHLGVLPCPNDDWAGRVLPRLRQPSTAAQAYSGLLTEAAIESLAADGERRLVVARGTIVTPLAASRAAELGLEIVHEQP